MTTKITLNNIADTALATLTGPKITTIVYPGDDTATDTAGGATINLTGAGFQSGCSVLVSGTASSVVTFISSTQISFIAPALSAGTYVIYVINPDGGTAISIPGISYSGTPNWTTTAGSLGTAYETGAISSTLTATGDAPITYTLASGTLPTGSSLSSDGTLSGTAVATASATTYTFTVSANDAQNQTTNRAFSLTINPDVVTWSSPADSTTYTVATNTAISNVALSATSAAGGSITYTADTLPTGLSITGANIAGTPTVSANTSTILTATSTATRAATRTINWVVSVASDTFFKYTTMLLQGASTTFVDDASTNNFGVTIAGDTKPNSFNPYTPGYYSVFMNGGSSGDLLSFPNSFTAYNLSGGTWTVEMWMYPTMSTFSDGDCRMLMAGANGNNTAWQLYINSNRLIGWNLPAGGIVGLATANSAFSFNTWTHVAVVCQAGSARIYVNGVSAAGPTNVTLPTSATVGFKIGFDNVGTVSTQFAGFITNVRINTTTAIYTAAFTPSTIPLTAVSGTSLLTCQSNRYLDTSTNALSVTVAGSPRINSFDPFVPNTDYSSYGSAYFDGTDDRVQLPSSANFVLVPTTPWTMEAWIYPTTNYTPVFWQNGGAQGILITHTDRGRCLFGGTTGSGSGDGVIGGNSRVCPANAWSHVAITCDGNHNFYISVNGLRGTAVNRSGENIAYTRITLGYIGAQPDLTSFFIGYISNARVVNGTEIYTGNFTPPTAPLTAVGNTQLLTLQNNQSVNNHTFLDNSSNNFLVTRNGNATQGTFSPYGGNWSTFIPSAGTTYITAGSSTSLALGAGNFTIECWLYLNSLGTYTTIFDWRTNGDALLGIPVLTDYNNNGTLTFAVGAQPSFTLVVTSSSTMPINSWFHLALVRSGSTVTMYFNGTSVGSGTSSANIGIQTFNIGNPQAANYNAPMYISNVRLVKGTAVYTSNFTPSTTPLTAIANTQLLTCQSSMLLDDSPNRFSVSKVATISVQRFSPFNPSIVTPTSYSGYFDGTGDYLTHTNIVLGSTFTIECWIYKTNTSSTFAIILGNGDASWFSVAESGLIFSVGGTTFAYTGTFLLNTWNHIALVNNAGTLSTFINGIKSVTTYTGMTGGWTQSYIGQFGSQTGYPFIGYISNVRVISGTAVYTSNFTPSTTPLTAITNTQLLTCQSTRFIDNSTNNYTITAFGNSQPTQQNPFGFTSATTNGYTVSTIGGSGYFDGTGDFLSGSISTMGVGLFTAEAWVYVTNRSVARCVFTTRSGNTSDGFQVIVDSGGEVRVGFTGSNFISSAVNSVIVDQWYHIAVTRNSANAMTLWINGISSGASTRSENFSSTVFRVGITAENLNPMLGYISDFRIVNGQPLYTSNFVPPTAPLTPIQNSTLLLNMTSAGIYDAAMMTTMETVGDAKLSTAVSKFGGSSMSFDGTGDYLKAPFNPAYSLPGDFTVETWIYLTSAAGTGNQTIASFGYNNSTGAGPWGFYLNGNGPYTLYFNSTPGNKASTTTVAIPINTWTHVTYCRTGSTGRFFVNGTIVGTAIADAFTYSGTTESLFVGIMSDASSAPLYGYLDDLRITKGVARYTSNFTPPTTEFKTF
jgi:hypothetical protein